jgi:hypothetical protein
MIFSGFMSAIKFIATYIDNTKLSPLSLYCFAIPIIYIWCLCAKIIILSPAILLFMTITIISSHVVAFICLIISSVTPEHALNMSFKYGKYTKYLAVFIYMLIVIANLWCETIIVSSFDNYAFITSKDLSTTLINTAKPIVSLSERQPFNSNFLPVPITLICYIFVL